jgi:hypothetical protein
VPSPDERPEFLPGDTNRPPEKLDVAEPAPPPAAPRYPLPLLIVGGLLVVALLIGGFAVIRLSLGDPAAPNQAGPGEPLNTLTPRTGTPAPLQVARPGERVQVQGLYGSGTVMVVRAEWSDSGDLPPSEGRKYLNVEIRYDVAAGSMMVHPNFYAAYDAARNEYYPGIGSGKPQFAQQEINSGRSATGWVSIELPPGEVIFVISDEGINPLVAVEIPDP